MAKSVPPRGKRKRSFEGCPSNEPVTLNFEEKKKPLGADDQIGMTYLTPAPALRCPRCKTFKPTCAFAREMVELKIAKRRACIPCAAMTTVERVASNSVVVQQMSEQQCCVCRVTRPLTDFRMRAGSTVRVVATCNGCTKSAGDVTHQPCRVCHESKPLTDYKSAPACTYGVVRTCKTCQKRIQVSLRITVAEKQCGECKEMKPAAAFYKHNVARDGLASFCKSCSNTIVRARHRTKDGFLKQLYRNCKMAYGLSCTLPTSSTHDYAKQQRDLCEYSGIKLNFSSGSSWQASIDAKVSALGHVPGNCVLIILELNIGHGGWSPDRIVEHLRLRHQLRVQTVTELVACLRTPSTVEWRRVQRMLSNAQVNTAARNAKHHRSQNQHGYDMTIADVCDIILEQDNRCHWSQQCLDWSVDANHWAPSFERLDVFKGYMKPNVRLVCRAFNAQDFTATIKHTEGAVGHQGWSTHKYAQFFTSVCCKYATQLSELDKKLDFDRLVRTAPDCVAPLTQ